MTSLDERWQSKRLTRALRAWTLPRSVKQRLCPVKCHECAGLLGLPERTSDLALGLAAVLRGNGEQIHRDNPDAQFLGDEFGCKCLTRAGFARQQECQPRPWVSRPLGSRERRSLAPRIELGKRRAEQLLLLLRENEVIPAVGRLRSRLRFALRRQRVVGLPLLHAAKNKPLRARGRPHRAGVSVSPGIGFDAGAGPSGRPP